MARKARRRQRDEAPRDLSELELSIMNVVWDLGECTSTQVVEEFRKVRRLAPTTIRTVLTNIEKKGYIERVPSLERGFRFRPTVSRNHVARRTLHRLVSALFKGSPRLALAHLLEDERLDDDDLEEIRRLLADSGSGRQQGKKPPGDRPRRSAPRGGGKPRGNKP